MNRQPPFYVVYSQVIKPEPKAVKYIARREYQPRKLWTLRAYPGISPRWTGII
jgi:hypothetical protein